MPIIISDYEEEYNEEKDFFIKCNEKPRCPECQKKLTKKDWVERGKKEAGGNKTKRLIERRRCPRCKRSYRLLPGDQIPSKHYSAEVIEKVIDEDYELSEDEQREMEDYPCEATIGRWKVWATRLTKNVEGQLRSIGHRILELSVEFLAASDSLLRGIKNRIPRGWLAFVVKLMIETGGTGALPGPP